MSDPCNRVRCKVCLGRKIVEGIGYTQKECHNCEGVGYLFRVEVEKEAPVVTPVKRRGRPPKIKTDNNGTQISN